ncbi:MAG: DUF134 domain-containing protein [Desulfobacterales bacterium]|nr:DUF134 domain-containing protein [Desulfobacterales bacterium]
MPRPKKPRFVSGYPMTRSFVPEGEVPSGEIRLTLEEMEAVRLTDFEGLDQAAAADLMGVSRQTYGRVLGRARQLVAEALVTGKALRVGGGIYQFRGHGGRRRRGGGRFG